MGGGLLIMLAVVVTQGRAATTTGPAHLTDPALTTEPEPTGAKKFGDRCETTQECGFRGSICDSVTKACQCKPELPATNHIDKCGVEVEINGSCFFNEQCERVQQTECKDGRCACRFEMVPTLNKFNKIECIASYEPPPSLQYVDPAMIGVLVGMALMFVIICVVLRLFSKARWRDNRTIFNTPNPRLMNVSLLRETKPPERRGSKGSNNRAPSRQPSIASLRAQSPQSQGSRTSPEHHLKDSTDTSPSHHQADHHHHHHHHHHHNRHRDSIAHSTA